MRYKRSIAIPLMVLLGTAFVAAQLTSSAYACGTIGVPGPPIQIEPSPTGGFTVIAQNYKTFGANAGQTCGCGLAVPTSLVSSVDSVKFVQAGTDIPIPGFSFAPDPDVTTALENASPAGSGFEWFGFSSTLRQDVEADQPIDLMFEITPLPGVTDIQLYQAFAGAQIGTGETDREGKSFIHHFQSPIVKPSLDIVKWITINDDGIKIEEKVTLFQRITVVEATLKDPKFNIYAYHDIPKPIPAFIAFKDPNWSPIVELFDGEWELKMQVIATYKDPVTGEIKEIEQKIIIHFDVVNGKISTKGGDLEMHKEIKIFPHPAQLNGNLNIQISEDIKPGEKNVVVSEITLAKPSGEVISYTALPIDITLGPAIIPFPGPAWVSTDNIVALNEAGLWEADIEIIAFYEDGVQEVKKINQKLFVTFNVLPESFIGAIAIIGTAMSAFVAYSKLRTKKI